MFYWKGIVNNISEILLYYLMRGAPLKNFKAIETKSWLTFALVFTILVKYRYINSVYIHFCPAQMPNVARMCAPVSCGASGGRGWGARAPALRAGTSYAAGRAAGSPSRLAAQAASPWPDHSRPKITLSASLVTGTGTDWTIVAHHAFREQPVSSLENCV